MKKKFLKIAHRGYSELYPENTMEAFRAAVEAGADMIEFDVHLSADGRMVIIHDDTVDRTSDSRGSVGQMTLSQLRALDFSMEMTGPARIPLLEEVIDEFKDRTMLNIEIKNLPVKYPGIEKKIIDAVTSAECIDRVIISSFDHSSIARVKKLIPEIKTGMLYEASWLNFDRETDELAPYSLHPGADSIDVDQLRAAKEKGYMIYPWVAKTLFEVQRCVNYGFTDGVMVNDLRLFHGLV